MSGVALADTYKLVEERRSYFPEDYKSIALVVGTAVQLIQPEVNFNSSRFDTAPLMGFQGEERTYVPLNPILVKVYREEDIFFAENETLVLCGTGASRDEAILDFKKHVEYFYNFYKQQSESSLVGDALRLKKIYDNLFVET